MTTPELDEEWSRYGRAVIAAMGEVLSDVDESSHALILETADYWLSVGLAAALRRPEDAQRLLALIVEEAGESLTEIEQDADEFCTEVLG